MNTTYTSLQKRSTAVDFIKKYKVAIIGACLLMALLVVMNRSIAADIWSAGSGVAKNFANNLQNFYCMKLFPVLMLVNLVLLAVTKDDKKLAIIKRALITLIVVFAVIKGFDTIVNNTMVTLESDVNQGGAVNQQITW